VESGFSRIPPPAGNQIGRAFEVENADAVGEGPASTTTTVPFRVK
jgi:hypothetical protein